MNISRQEQHLETDAPRGPRARTRRLMLETAIQLMQGGATPSVSDVAEAAEVSRATAYRYFPSQSALVAAVVDEALGPILRWRSDSDEAEARVTDLMKSSLPRIDEFEATFRAALKHSLEEWARRQAGTLEPETQFHRGHRIGLLKDAVSPLKGQLPDRVMERLIHALSLVFGVESHLVLKDICGLDTDRACQVAVWAASALVREAAAQGAMRKPA